MHPSASGRWQRRWRWPFWWRCWPPPAIRRRPCACRPLWRCVTNPEAGMKTSDFRIGWRLLLRHPLHSAVEILGLATGFAVCFLLLGFVAYSFSYDSYVPQRERVFVIKHRLNFIPQPQWMEYTPFALRKVALRSGLPLQASVWWPSKAQMNQNGALREIDITAVDPAFEHIALQCAQCDLRQALTTPDGLALTQQ